MVRFYSTPGSNMGSVRFIEGTLYDTSMNDIYVPLDNLDFRKFIAAVDAAELQVGRKLTFDELVSLAKDYSHNNMA